MKHLIMIGNQGAKAVLVTGPAAGAALLRLEESELVGGAPETDFGPADMLDLSGLGRVPMCAAEVVAEWVREWGRTAEEIVAARVFLSQWPEGPQVRTFSELAWATRCLSHDLPGVANESAESMKLAREINEGEYKRILAKFRRRRIRGILSCGGNAHGDEVARESA